MLKTESYEPRSISSYQKCDTLDCVNIGVIFLTENTTNEVNPWIQTALSNVYNKLNLSEGDMKVLYRGVDYEDMSSKIYQASTIQNLIFFCDQNEFMKNSSISLTCNQLKIAEIIDIDLSIYVLSYNTTKIAPNFLRDLNLPMRIDENSFLLKKFIDESIIGFKRQTKAMTRQEKTKWKNLPLCNPNNTDLVPFCHKVNISNENLFEYDIDVISYPKPKASYLEKFDAASQWGSLIYMFSILLSFSQFLKLVAEEKDRKLRRGLIPYGLSSVAYYLSWIVFSFIFYFMFTSLMLITGVFIGVVTFQNTPRLIVWTLFFITSFAYSLLAMLITACTMDFKSANKTCYTIIVASFFLQIFFSENTIMNMFFLEGRPLFSEVISKTLSFLPSFPFTIISNNIHFFSGYHLSTRTFSYEKGTGYNMTTFFSGYQTKIPGIGSIDRPSDFYFTKWLIILCFIYIIAICFFDQYVESNTGSSRNIFTIFWRMLIGKKKIYQPLLESTATGQITAESMINLSKPLMMSGSSVPALYSIINVSKEFHNGKKSVFALKNVNLALQKNQTVALLGENGAGKSTLISIMTGVLSSSEGCIYREGTPYGIELSDRLKVSVCPQYDLLWNELTIYENMELIGRMRGLTQAEIDQQVIEILGKFFLLDQRDVIVSSLSGGMRRRVSIGLALLGNAELLIFDEPTTGLDPVNRKIVWAFLRELKLKGKTILLTTHIMDEADAIADSIAVIHQGQILLNKSSVEIKDEFKKLNVIFSLKKWSEKFQNRLIDYFTELYHNTFQIKYSSSTLIKLTVPNEDHKTLMQFVKDFEELKTNEKMSFFSEFVDSFEVASLDLEEAYILLNEKQKNNLKLI